MLAAFASLLPPVTLALVGFVQDAAPPVAVPAAPVVAPAPPPPPAPVVLPSRIAEVVVHRTLARIVRTAEVPGDGRFAIEGLPGLVNPDSVHVRLAAGSVTGVEVRKRRARTASDERLAELQAAYEAALAEKRVLTDEQGLRLAARDHFSKLLGVEQGSHLQEMSDGRPNAQAWEQNLTYVMTGIETAQTQLRDVEGRLKLSEARTTEAHNTLAKALSTQVDLLDVLMDVHSPPGGLLEVEYVVSQAGWSPVYELRTSNEATRIDFSYRARVTQLTGEDWTDCSLVLSTAQPERGARGVEPQPIKARIAPVETSGATRAPGSTAESPEAAAPFAALPDDGNRISADPAADPTSVEAQGLSVQFRLTDHETILSRMDPTTVLVGERPLAALPEHVVSPAVATTVWLRGRTQNTTPWVMLPGAAAVYFGADFIGSARFTEPVMPGQGFTLHLGADPGLSCVRVQTSDVHEGPSFLSQRQSQLRAFRITLENHGGHPALPDGSVDVIVRQAIPVPADDRIQIEVVSESRPASDDARWLKDRQERGLRTWLLNVPAAGRADLEFEVRTSWPDELGMRVDGAW